MRQPIMTSVAFLATPSAPADPSSPDDRATAADLLDTLAAHDGECVGLAANMIGVSRRIIAFRNEETGRIMAMFNPRITSRADRFDTHEGCLSLDGQRPTVRYRHIGVDYQTRSGRDRSDTFDGWTAQIIQHEIDHCDGVII